jgi:hypothetical protein
MDWRFRRSITLLPGVRINLSRRGIGYSVGPRGLTIGRAADGTYRSTVTVPGTGLYNTSVLGSRKKRVAMPHGSHQAQLSWTSPANWPRPPAGWSPPPGWRPDPSWGPPPAGWQFWQPAAPEKAHPVALAWARSHPKTTTAAGLVAFLFAVGAANGDGGEPPVDRQDVAALSSDRRADEAASEAAARQEAERIAAEQAAAAKAAEEAAAAQAAAELAARAEAERVAAEKAAAEAHAADEAAEAARIEAERRAAADATAKAEAERKAAAQAAAAAPAPAAGARDFSNCDELNSVYPHGVGRPGAVDKTSGSPPVTTFERSDALYSANSESDRDGDDIACEKR